jgi:hypothetical protein
MSRGKVPRPSLAALSKAAPSAASALLDHYAQLESNWIVRDNPDYESLVTPNGNGSTPFHRWFHLKEGYSHRLLARVLKDTEWEAPGALTVLDPYAGSGTTLVSALDLAAGGELDAVSAYGVEANPFLHTVASAKLAGRLDVDARYLRTYLDAVATFAGDRRRRHDPPPSLSTFGRDEYWPDGNLLELGRLRRALDAVDCTDDGARMIGALLVAATVEPSSYLRRDGRALRYEPSKQPVPPLQEFLRRADVVIDDVMSSTPPSSARAVVRLGDGRVLDGISGQFRADLVLFSPPYPNNIDYTEVYKLEAWALGQISSPEEFRAQRSRTVRSHPSLKWDEQYAYRARSDAIVIDRLLAPLTAAIPESRDREDRRRLVCGYADDMLSTLAACRSRLKASGSLVFVVGNSLHGHGEDTWLFAADLVIARLGELAGFTVKSIEVARRPARRRGGGDLLRESVVFLHVR